MDDAASEIARLRAALAASEARVASAEADLAQVRAVVMTSEAMIRRLKLEIAKNAPRAIWPEFGTGRPADRPDGITARRTRGRRHRG
ncbi:hypothetical protein AGR6A_pTi0053 [Agrobacterium sp. NCPPB 925]|nr:hypothetical protein AGR6A_pTi0053 [Agrobacterium sp. NCPPB 925]